MGASLVDLQPEEQRFADAEIEHLLSIGAIEPAPPGERTHISRLFMIPKKGKIKKWRMIHDAAWINVFHLPGTCRVEGLTMLPSMLKPNDNMCSLDIDSAYFMVGLHVASRRYFTFQIGGGRYAGLYFRYTVLPFGWNWSPAYFTLTLGVAIQHLRTRTPAVKLLVYVDDLLITSSTATGAAAARDVVLELFNNLGIAVAPDKGVFNPCRRLEHLGMVIDSEAGIFGATPAKASRLRAEAKALRLRSAEHARWVSKKQLAKFAGLAQFLAPCIQFTNFRLRAIYDCLNDGRDSYTGRVRLDNRALLDLQWWGAMRDQEMQAAIWPPELTAVLHTDASPWGWGATLEVSGEPARVLKTARGFWNSSERLLHITLLELRAVALALETFDSDVAGLAIRHWEDNQACVGAIGRMVSRSPALMLEVRNLHKQLQRLDVTLHTSYIRSEDNILADGLSRERDKADVQINPQVFAELGGSYLFTIDRFASDNNRLLARFNSRWRCPGTEAVDALTVPDSLWRNEVNWCNPPWPLLGRVVAKLERSGAQAAVVAPGGSSWSGAEWHPRLRAIADWVVALQPHPDLFLPGSGGQPGPRYRAPRWPTLVYFVGIDPPEAWAQARFIGRPEPVGRFTFL